MFVAARLPVLPSTEQPKGYSPGSFSVAMGVVPPCGKFDQFGLQRIGYPNIPAAVDALTVGAIEAGERTDQSTTRIGKHVYIVRPVARDVEKTLILCVARHPGTIFAGPRGNRSSTVAASNERENRYRSGEPLRVTLGHSLTVSTG